MSAALASCVSLIIIFRAPAMSQCCTHLRNMALLSRTSFPPIKYGDRIPYSLWSKSSAYTLLMPFLDAQMPTAFSVLPRSLQVTLLLLTMGNRVHLRSCLVKSGIRLFAERILLTICVPLW